MEIEERQVSSGRAKGTRGSESRHGTRLVADIVRTTAEPGVRWKHRVWSLVSTSFAGERTLLSGGQPVVQRVLASGVREFTRDGPPLTTDVEATLGRMLARETRDEDRATRVNQPVDVMRASGLPDMDAIMGSGVPRAIGERWPIDVRFLVEQLAASRFEVVPADITGAVELLGWGKHAGAPCLVLRGKARVRNLFGPRGEAPHGDSLVLTVDACIPSDASDTSRLWTRITARVTVPASITVDSTAVYEIARSPH